jgi:hypothetical protein
MSDLNAAAEALAGDDVSAEPINDAPEMSEEDALSAAYDKASGLTADPEPEEDPEPEAEDDDDGAEAEDGEEAEAEPEPEKVEAPNGLPREVREKWAEIPEDARAAIERSHRELSAKLTDQGRQIQGLSPIRDGLMEAMKLHPEVANMRPEQVAQEVSSLVRFNAAFKADPVGTFAERINVLGLREQVMQALGVEAPEGGADQHFSAMQREIAALKQQVAQASDPARIQNEFRQMTAIDRANAEVMEFASTAPRWGDIEAIIPEFIGVARQFLGEGASGKDVLAKAYEIADYATKPAATAAGVATQAAPQPDPKRVQQAIKAKSVNVKSQPTGNGRQLTEAQALEAAYDRASRR